MSEFSILLYVLFHVFCVLSGGFIVKQKIEVPNENIIDKVKASLTQCHLKCKLNHECIGYGTLENTLIGQITECYLIKSDQRSFSTNSGRDEALGMYVIEMDGGIDINQKKISIVAPKEVFSSPSERVNRKNNLLTTIQKLSPSYTVKFDFKPTQFQSEWTNVLHLTATENPCCDIGDRVPGVWFHKSHRSATMNRLHIASAVNGDGNYRLSSESIVPLDEWTTVVIMQRPEGAHQRYTVKVGDVVIGSVINEQAREYTNVKVFGADSWYEAAKGSMRNFVINHAEI